LTEGDSAEPLIKRTTEWIEMPDGDVYLPLELRLQHPPETYLVIILMVEHVVDEHRRRRTDRRATATMRKATAP
jgi:hypothetical protein